MRINFFMLLLIASFAVTTACKEEKQAAATTKADPTRFPDTINSRLTEAHKRIPGSKVYALLPEQFKFVRAQNQIQKDQNTFIQIVETPSAKFENAKKAFSRENIEAGGTQVDIVRDIRFGPYDGIFLDGPSNLPTQRKASMVFGDDDFVCLIFGEYPSDSPTARNEVLEIFKTMVHDKEQSAEDLSGPFYTFDPNITGFKPAVLSKQVDIYNKDGDPEAEKSLPTSMNFAPIPVLPVEAQEKYFEQLVEESQQGQLKITAAATQQLVINGMPATVLETTVVSGDRSGVFFAAILNGSNSALVFISSAFDDPLQRLPQYKATLESIRFN
ncbi:hypothetical protein [Gilvibacter sediminis]|uniref:hypothetical protein n=1 Tax=Gilvibacter sediminis TaxID=379071 RepID=UPI002350D7BB|nr:hypothetical protein [Gilvibacter sediminis]MDC7997929.1 hypothetical protein [Gilvibacter sediminis]